MNDISIFNKSDKTFVNINISFFTEKNVLVTLLGVKYHIGQQGVCISAS